jgi:hypothetical protein
VYHRPDKFQEHVRKVHAGSKNIDQITQDSKVPYVPDFLYGCGACNVRLTSWEERITHVADHFYNGFDMNDWREDWATIEENPFRSLPEREASQKWWHQEDDLPWCHLTPHQPVQTKLSAITKDLPACDAEIVDQINHMNQSEAEPQDGIETGNGYNGENNSFGSSLYGTQPMQFGASASHQHPRGRKRQRDDDDKDEDGKRQKPTPSEKPQPTPFANIFFRYNPIKYSIRRDDVHPYISRIL